MVLVVAVLVVVVEPGEDSSGVVGIGRSSSVMVVLERHQGIEGSRGWSFQFSAGGFQYEG